MKMMHLERAKVTSPDSDSYPDTETAVGIPLDWPLKDALVVINGSNATISVPKYDASGHKEKMVRFDRLTNVAVTEGKRNGKPVTITGRSQFLEQIVGVKRTDDEDPTLVTMVVEDWGQCLTC